MHGSLRLNIDMRPNFFFAERDCLVKVSWKHQFYLIKVIRPFLTIFLRFMIDLSYIRYLRCV